MRKKKILITALISAICLTGCSMVTSVENKVAGFIGSASNAEEKNKLNGYTNLSEIDKNAFYIQAGDGTLYPLHLGYTNIKSSTTHLRPDRYVALTDDDSLVPTLYRGESLVYYTDETVPDEYYIERMRDNGWTIGLFSMKSNNSDNIQWKKEGSEYVPSSSIIASIGNFPVTSENPVLTLKTFNGMPVDATRLSESGTLEGLVKGEKYEVEIFLGSIRYVVDMYADTHFFNAYEMYECNTYNLDASNLAKINLPNDLQEGYYVINGKGMFRYVNCDRVIDEESTEFSVEDIDFNVPYYYKDENGKTYTYSEWQELNGENTEYEKNTLDQTITYYVGENKSSLNTSIQYNDESLNRPVLRIVHPDGSASEMLGVSENGKINLNFTEENPSEGMWTFEIYNSGKQNLTVNISCQDNLSAESEFVIDTAEETSDISDAHLDHTEG